MAVMSVINLSELEGTKRLDAEYYQPEYLVLVSKYKKTKLLLRDVVKSIIHPKEIKRDYGSSGYIFVLAQNIKSGFLDFSEKRYVSEEVAKTMSQNLLQRGDVLFVRTGAIGEVAVYLGKLNNVLASAHVLIAHPNFKVSPFYLMIYFNTRIGKDLIIRGAYGALQPEITPDYLKSIPIPVFDKPFEKEIEQQVIESNELLEQSHLLYYQAENLLLFELGLQNFKPKDKLFYKVSLSETLTSHRIDAEYFNPSYEEVINKTKNYKNGYGKLLSFAENIKPKFDPHKFPQKTFSYVELADINASIGVIQSSTNITGEEAPSRAKRILKENDVIVSSVEGSLEKVALVDGQFEGSLASTGFFQFRPKNILPEVLLILSKSPIIQNQLKKECAGTILTAVPKEALRKLIIPDLPKQTQQKIAKLVQESHESKRKAKQLLEEAKKKVEDAIEKEK